VYTVVTESIDALVDHAGPAIHQVLTLLIGLADDDRIPNKRKLGTQKRNCLVESFGKGDVPVALFNSLLQKYTDTGKN
jgi:hypothetical protein